MKSGVAGNRVTLGRPPTPYGKGNIYVMDMFSQGFEPPPEGEAATFTTQSTVYWHEA